MKQNKIKILFPILAIVISLSLTSCLDDLNIDPIDPNVTQSFQQDGVFAKIYASLSLTGQEGPSGNGDVDGIDEGTSAFVRLLWNLNTLTTDEAICSWGDPGVPEMNFNRWSASHDQITGMYGRLYFNITLCNHFLEETKDQSDDKTLKQRAEVRFMRAMNYFYLLDMFGNVPLVTTVTSELMGQTKRADLFEFVEDELLEAEQNMYEPMQAPKYRVDKAAAWMLLARLYLNAQVYTGTASWNNAAIYAKRVIDSSYELNGVYKHLFMADNAGTWDGSTVNTAPKEIIFAIAVDGVKTKSWGSSLFLIASTQASDMPNWGSKEAWSGNRARAALVRKFFPTGTFPSNADLKDLSTVANDDRALFFAEDRTVEVQRVAIFKDGLSVRKHSNLRADGGSTSDDQFADTDVPFMRAAEAYLTYAEAVTRGASVIDGYTALQAVNAIRTRSNASIFATLDLTRLADEWSREFFFEGRRRMDLIRFGYYGGNNEYNWDWKGGAAGGTKFSEIYNIFPIPSSDMNANSKLEQNEGY